MSRVRESGRRAIRTSGVKRHRELVLRRRAIDVKLLGRLTLAMGESGHRAVEVKGVEEFGPCRVDGGIFSSRSYVVMLVVYLES